MELQTQELFTKAVATLRTSQGFAAESHALDVRDDLDSRMLRLEHS